MRRWMTFASTGVIAAAVAFCVSPAWSESKQKPAPAAKARTTPKPKTAERSPSPVAGLDLTRIRIDDDGVTAPAAQGRVAHLSLDPDLQKTATRLLERYRIPEAAIVLMEVETGRTLVWASRVESGPKRDLCVEATAPAASVFKVVTGSALVEEAGLGPQTKQCYSGGQSRITAADLIDDPRRDKWCASLSDAMGRSLNTVFARLALQHLTPKRLTATAKSYGFDEVIPFDVPVAKSKVSIPEDRLGFGRTAAGFWNSTLSPFAGAVMMATIANHGEMRRPYIVESVTQKGTTIYQAKTRREVLRKVTRPETARALTTMLEATVASGTSRVAFRDSRGRPYLPNIRVAGKTGTLTDHEKQRLYTWFVGFAPSREPQVAVSVLAANSPVWRAKANVVARDVLRAYFAKKGAPGVTKP